MERKTTIKEATELWVRSFDAIQQGMIAKLMRQDIDDWHEITVPTVSDRVYVYSNGSGTIHDIMERDGELVYVVELDDGDTAYVECERDEIEVEYDDGLPMWGTMWSFGESADDWWLESEEGLRSMSECGFRIFESEEFGYFFGIDGCGYDFYEAHWIPLYKARGLQWHDTEEE